MTDAQFACLLASFPALAFAAIGALVQIFEIAKTELQKGVDVAGRLR